MSSFMRYVIGQPLAFKLLLLALFVISVQSFKLSQKRALPLKGAPKRPAHFTSVEQLNKYLSDLTEYYTVLGRPRFGKRADDSFAENDLYPKYMTYNLDPTVGQNDPDDVDFEDLYSRLALALVERILSRDDADLQQGTNR